MRLIDADALRLSHCVECTLYGSGCPEKNGGVCDWDCIGHIDDAPTVEAVKHGCMVERCTGEAYIGMGRKTKVQIFEHYCSECKNEFIRKDFKYCPWCGAKMDEVSE